MTASELAFKGRLVTSLKDYAPREAQIEMANAIEKTILDKKDLVVEAGTGTGKTFAYLIPSLALNKKTIVATGTKTLQDQLFHNDIPRLIKAMGLASRIQILKGRANYLCRYRIELNATQATFSSQELAKEFDLIRDKLPTVVLGEVNEFNDIHDDSSVWPFVTSTTDNCLGSECDYVDECFLVQARRKAMKADILVINHHLFFADSLLKEEGFGELLPGAEVIIFDEAHQLPEIAANFYGLRLSSRQLQELMRDISEEGREAAKDMQALFDLPASLIKLLDKIRRQLEGRESRRPWSEVLSNKPLMESLTFLQLTLKELGQVLEQASERSKGLARCYARCLEFIVQLKQFETNEEACIQWVEIFKSTFVLHATPSSVAESFSHRLAQNNAAHIFTSATLTVDGQFAHFTTPLGIKDNHSLIVESPFDYQQQAILYMPRGLPDPKSANYTETLINQVMPIIKVIGGRTFLLFTSYQALRLAGDVLSTYLDFKLLIQGDEPNHVLLQRFKQSERAILLGTASFWEGVDVKGDDLSCVVIDKLPFVSPADPVIKAKIELMNRQGKSAFDNFQIPSAVVTLKQGVGRLIRDCQDKGILVIGDPRLYARAYGQRFISSLPAMKLTRSEEFVLEFAKNLDLVNENISN